MAYYRAMVLIETSVFTRQVQATLTADEYRAFQLHLLAHPDAGDVIPGTGGLRKVRWGLAGRGKRGGVRVIYYWRTTAGQIFLLFLYPKNVRSTLTTAEMRALSKLITED